jgi:SAM-dependent methyltransferase
MNQDQEKAAEYWNHYTEDPNTWWWQIPTIIKHINRVISGVEFEQENQGLIYKIKKQIDKPFAKGISIGCGDGRKEIKLIVEGVVESMDAFDIASDLLKKGTDLAIKNNIANKIKFRNEDPLTEICYEEYDLVYWDNSLHHMLDTPKAIDWSYRALKKGGYLIMNDYVGASRFQFTDLELEINTRVRSLLPERLLIAPNQPGFSLPRVMERVSSDFIKNYDPTEAADSHNIIPSLRAIFNSIEIIYTGGCIYHCALNDILANFNEGDVPMLNSLLLLDEVMAMSGLSHYAVAFCRK